MRTSNFLKKVKPSARSPKGLPKSPKGRFHLPSKLLLPVVFLPLLTAYSLTSLRLPSSVLANSIYNRSPWPEAYKDLTFEKDNTDFEDAAHPCSRTSGRSFKVTHKDSFKLIGLSVYVYVPNRNEPRFSQDLLRLSFLDSASQVLVNRVSPSYSAVISRDGYAQPTFEVYFPLNLNVGGGITYTANLECLTDEDLLRVVESSRLSDGETSYYDSTTSQSSAYYMTGRKILFTTFSEYLSSHFPSFAEATEGKPSLNGGPPKYHPVIFIHGLGGSPGAFDGSEDPTRNYVKLLTDLGYPKEYLYLYSYGYKEDGRGGTYYNYQGDIREIAQGMEIIVNTLSDKHKASGGDGKVDIVAHSLGNLVTRQYLLTHKDNHRIRRYVAVGAPFKGAWLASIDRGIYSMPLLGKRLEGAVAKGLLKIYNSKRNNPIDNGSVAIRQLASNSEFLEGANGLNNVLINNVEVHALYGDIKAKISQKIFNINLSKEASVGDGIILSDSASYVGWASNSRTQAFYDKILIDAKVQRLGDSLAFEVSLPNVNSIGGFHTDILSKPDVKGKIGCLLSKDVSNSCY